MVCPSMAKITRHGAVPHQEQRMLQCSFAYEIGSCKQMEYKKLQNIHVITPTELMEMAIYIISIECLIQKFA